MSAGAEDDDALGFPSARPTTPRLEIVRPPGAPGAAGGGAAEHQRGPWSRSPESELGDGERADHAHKHDHDDPEHEHDHHILIDAEEDRWAWRRKIRENPRKLFFYRLAVAVAGLFFIVAGLVTGPLPGPGGIPLVLLGLAIWASEFEWAQRLMLVFKAQLRRYRGWARPRQVLFWVAFFSGCGLLGYLYMLVLGVPSWMPEFAGRNLARLPGVS